ncbi:MAG: hypothetical protein FWC41_05825, partial [Firmicutes bacterium]|nr:hypothetical protein [Bacillota bacterium]
LTGGNIGKGGFYGGLTGMGMGAFMGGISDVHNALNQRAILFSSAKELGVDPKKALPNSFKNSKSLTKAKNLWFRDAPDPIDHIVNSAKTNGNSAAAEAEVNIYGQLTGRGTIYYHQDKAFTSIGKLFRTMGHELVHISQYAALAGEGYGMLFVPSFRNMLEHYAVNYELSLQGLPPIDNGYNFSNVYPFYNQLNYESFSWTNNHSFWTWLYFQKR